MVEQVKVEDVFSYDRVLLLNKLEKNGFKVRGFVFFFKVKGFGFFFKIRGFGFFFKCIGFGLVY